MITCSFCIITRNDTGLCYREVVNMPIEVLLLETGDSFIKKMEISTYRLFEFFKI